MFTVVSAKTPSPKQKIVEKILSPNTNIAIKRAANTTISVASAPKIIKMDIQSPNSKSIIIPSTVSPALKPIETKILNSTKLQNFQVIRIVPTKQKQEYNQQPDVSIFPISSQADFDKIEKWCKFEKSQNKLLDMIKIFKSSNSNLVIVLKQIFSDEFLKDYSWDGKNDHKPLSTTGIGKLITTVLKGEMSVAQFERSIRVIIFQAHLRYSKSNKSKSTIS